MANYAHRRGLTVTENFIGCMEEFYFNGVAVIRDTLRTLTGLIPAELTTKIDWLEALGFPHKNPVLWWGPPTTQDDLAMEGFSIGGSGVLNTNCPAPVSDPSVLTFPGVQQYLVYLKVERASSNKLQFGFDFKTLNRGGTIFYQKLDQKDRHFLYVSLR
ncbi:unnamed protein product [Protopolystoma xenopodis]|uniref:Uncharacterized protein n=1 Tax=Protopolystoma xenopodis TaxID=117903 RepID=A0A448WF71_9PLAT|nr:unnamed protein product [Protopolystoma xenopodis]